MELGKNKHIKIISMLVLFAAVSALLISELPGVLATPSLTKDPSIPEVGGTMDVVLDAGSLGDLDHLKGKIRVYEPGKTPKYDNTQAFNAACEYGSTNVNLGVNGGGYVPADARVWEFRQDSNNALANEYTITDINDQLKVRFGVNGATVTVAGGGIVKTAGVTLDENSGVWVLVEGVGAAGDTIDHFATSIANGGVGGVYNMASCGYDNNGAPGSTFQYGILAPFETQEPIPPEDCDCTKPTIFTVEYNNAGNPNPVTVEVYKNSKELGNPNKVLLTFLNVNPGDPIAVDSGAFPRARNTVNANTAFLITEGGVELARIIVHTSCSQPLFIGQVHPGDNGVSLTVISGTDKDGNQTIPPLECKPDEPPPPPQDCDCTKPTIFTVEYNNAGNLNPVTVEVYKNSREIGDPNKILLSFENVNPGDEIEVDSGDFPRARKNVNPDTAYLITQGGVELARIIVHTSCSQPLFIGQVHSGDNGVSLTVISGIDKDGNQSIPPAECQI